ncbi:MAG: late competence development ComFB family protein [Oscillospiraceae bacterium]|nr:late competence development ComFB family protein [Oscillospiraceae bacterium]
MAFTNLMEKMVDVRLEEFYKHNDFCTCSNCREDVKCVALNQLPPKYVSTRKGELFSKVEQSMDRQNVTDIDFALHNAINFVSKRPRHEERE